jgi:hypothetical protein
MPGYIPTHWEDKPSTNTPINAARLNNLESKAGEQIVQDGTSGPPVSLTNEAQDDWLYEN